MQLRKESEMIKMKQIEMKIIEKEIEKLNKLKMQEEIDIFPLPLDAINENEEKELTMDYSEAKDISICKKSRDFELSSEGDEDEDEFNQINERGSSDIDIGK